MDPTSGIIYNQSGEATLSFYVFENLRKPGYEGAYPYPDSIASDAYQCYKPLLAVRKDGDTIPATRLVIGGIYTDADDLTYTATCTIYLGSDPVSDFNVRRNHQYRNRVTISGITRTDDHSGNSVTFDARINVETTNPYYISLLRHKNLDAHFNITPMDIYLYDTERNPSMDIEVKDRKRTTGYVSSGSRLPSWRAAMRKTTRSAIRDRHTPTRTGKLQVLHHRPADRSRPTGRQYEIRRCARPRPNLYLCG